MDIFRKVFAVVTLATVSLAASVEFSAKGVVYCYMYRKTSNKPPPVARLLIDVVGAEAGKRRGGGAYWRFYSMSSYFALFSLQFRITNSHKRDGLGPGGDGVHSRQQQRSSARSDVAQLHGGVHLGQQLPLRLRGDL